jgi:hypothetical protein
MIFGFNTDVKYGDTLYHVQSEARHTSHLLQTMVFVSGRCVGKRATSYGEYAATPEFSEDRMHELLRDQHLFVVDAIKEGKLEVALQNSVTEFS